MRCFGCQWQDDRPKFCTPSRSSSAAWPPCPCLRSRSSRALTSAKKIHFWRFRQRAMSPWKARQLLAYWKLPEIKLQAREFAGEHRQKRGHDREVACARWRKEEKKLGRGRKSRIRMGRATEKREPEIALNRKPPRAPSLAPDASRRLIPRSAVSPATCKHILNLTLLWPWRKARITLLSKLTRRNP
jgi:hypothetical protein